jgi:hypothetical protein
MRNFFPLALLAFAVSTTFASSSSPTQDVPNLDHSLFNIQVAQNYLKMPKTDLGGHREKAIAALSTAINEVNAALLFAKQHPSQ